MTSTTTTNTEKLATIIDGKQIASTIRKELRDQITTHLQNNNNNTNKPPGLAVILVGNRPDSATYVRMKRKACTEVGITSHLHTYENVVTEQILLDRINELNHDPLISGILIQLPLPSHIRESVILHSVHPEKDVDGLHPTNVARLWTGDSGIMTSEEALDWTDLSSVPFHLPCTPQACIELLNRMNVDIGGKNAVVIGRSNLVGLPVSRLLLHRDATLTILHSRSTNAKKMVRMADIVIVAVGKAEMVKGDWFHDEKKEKKKKNVVVIDVGINAVDDANCKRGYRLVGDVDYEEVRKRVEMITPVPGGVGPMTIAMLLRNTWNGYKRMHGYGCEEGGGLRETGF